MDPETRRAEGSLVVGLRTLNGTEDWDGVKPRWIDLVEDPETTSGFWCDPRVIWSESRGFTDKVMVALVERAGRLVSVVPFRIQASSIPLQAGLVKAGSIRATRVRLYDTSFPVSAGEQRASILDEVFQAISSQTPGSRWRDLFVVPEWPLDERTSPVLKNAWLRSSQPAYRLKMPKSWDDYRSSLSGGTRRGWGRRTRNLEREFDGKLEIKCYRDTESADELASHIDSVWRRSWHYEPTRSHVYDPSFLAAMAENGWLRGYVLFGRGEPIAFGLGFQYRGTFVYQATGYDAKLAAHSPGHALNWLLIQDMFSSDPPDLLDFGFGHNQYKASLCNQTSEWVELWSPLTHRGRAACTITWLIDVGVGRVRDLLADAGVLRRMKEFVRSGRARHA